MIAIVLLGCGGSQTGGEPPAPSPRSGESRESAAESTASATRTEPAAEPTRDPGPLPTLGIRGTPDRAGHVAIAIENRGTTSTSLDSTIVLEVSRGEASRAEAWVAVDGVTLRASPDCATEPPRCQELVPGAALAPPDWLGTIGDAQCACERCVPAEPGTYRFVVRTCDGGHTVPGEPFELAR